MRPFFVLRLTLATVAAANLLVAYLFFFTPDILAEFLRLETMDSAHRVLTMMVGALLSAFGLGAILAFLRPLKYGEMIILLLLSHFMLFVIGVVVLARGEMVWEVVIPEMLYFLLVSTALVRFYPLREKGKKGEQHTQVQQSLHIEEQHEHTNIEEQSTIQ